MQKKSNTKRKSAPSNIIQFPPIIPQFDESTATDYIDLNELLLARTSYISTVSGDVEKWRIYDGDMLMIETGRRPRIHELVIIDDAGEWRVEEARHAGNRRVIGIVHHVIHPIKGGAR